MSGIIDALEWKTANRLGQSLRWTTLANSVIFIPHANLCRTSLKHRNAIRRANS